MVATAARGHAGLERLFDFAESPPRFLHEARQMAFHPQRPLQIVNCGLHSFGAAWMHA